LANIALMLMPYTTSEYITTGMSSGPSEFHRVARIDASTSRIATTPSARAGPGFHQTGARYLPNIAI
jgi:hypothetical protein